VKLVHLVGFIIKKFVTIHGLTNVKFVISVRSVACPAHLICLSNFIIFLQINYRVRTDTHTDLIKVVFRPVVLSCA